MRLQICYRRHRQTRRAVFILIALSLVVCLGPSRPKASTGNQDSFDGNGFRAGTIPDDLGRVTADLNDSDEFFQNAIRSGGQKHDYSQRIDALLKQMTVEEKVGQMTQLTLEMIVSGHDQNIQVDAAKLQKA